MSRPAPVVACFRLIGRLLLPDRPLIRLLASAVARGLFRELTERVPDISFLERDSMLPHDPQRLTCHPDVVVGAQVEKRPALLLAGFDQGKDLRPGVFRGGVFLPIGQDDTELPRLDRGFLLCRRQGAADGVIERGPMVGAIGFHIEVLYD